MVVRSKQCSANSLLDFKGATIMQTQIKSQKQTHIFALGAAPVPWAFFKA